MSVANQEKLRKEKLTGLIDNLSFTTPCSVAMWAEVISKSGNSNDKRMRNNEKGDQQKMKRTYFHR
jgi:hypothetical protein